MEKEIRKMSNKDIIIAVLVIALVIVSATAIHMKIREGRTYNNYRGGMMGGQRMMNGYGYQNGGQRMMPDQNGQFQGDVNADIRFPVQNATTTN